ncbi:MAG: proprotein convertase P-domain-containing protein [Bacteroidota bacterium]
MVKRLQFRFLPLLFLCLMASFSFAQISIGGTPRSWTLNLDDSDLPEVRTPAVDVRAMLEEDEEREQDNMPFRFAKPFPVSYSIDNVGNWTELENGDRIWRLKVTCEQALSVNLLYDNFFIPPGGFYYIYSTDRSEVIGAFGNHNNKDSRQFATAMVHSTSVILEYYEPAAVVGQGMISVSQIGHGYRFFPETDEGLGDAGNCQVNINCSPEGDDWQTVKKSVGRITLNGSELCTGSLINNVENDCRPLFLSANHCFDPTYDAINNPDVPGMLVYWNYERPGCANSGNVPTETTSGATLLANPSVTSDANGSDFALFELDEDPSTEYDVYFAGFNATDNPGNGGVGIHHPRGDAKKIATHTTIPPVVVNNNYWRIFWDATPNGHSVTEGGSSGSGLFDDNGNLIGQLFGGFLGGQPNCSDPANDEGDYGRLFISWDNRGVGDSRRRLQDWLDPNNTGTRVVNGRAACSATPDYELSADPTAQNSCGTNSVNYTINVTGTNGFTDPVTLSVSGLPTGATSTFAANPVTPDGSTTLTIGNLVSVADGSYSFSVEGSASSGNKSISVDLEVVTPNGATLISPADGSTDVSATPTLTWEVEAGADSYDVEVADDAGFTNIVASANVTTTSWMVSPPLDALTTYFWRVRHVRNDCGNDPYSAPFSFTTGENTVSCFTAVSTNVPVSIPNSTTVSSTINITSSGSISDVNVSFSGTHGRIRDLTFELESPSGTRIQLVDVDDPCNGRQRDFDFGFDDESTLTIDDDLPCPPTSGLAYQPEQALSTFNNQEVNGTWTLYITDGRNRFTGELEAWQLDICVGGGMVEPTCDDGIQNGLETGVDCGGPDCPPCMMEPTCDVPTGLFETNNTGTSVTLNWTDVPAANNYTVQGRQIGSSNWQLTLTANTNSTTVSNNIVPGVTYEWRVRSNCNDGMSDFSEIATFTAGSSSNSGLENRGGNVEINATLQVKVYPSPTSSLLNVSSNQTIEQIEILDMTGKLISSTRTDVGQATTQLNISYLINGHYFVRIKVADDVQTLRFVKM